MAVRLFFLRITVVATSLLACCPAIAAPKPWVVLTNCEYVSYAESDGDSFKVRSGTNEFLVRLYFVDAPESNLRYAERTHEQSEYFGVTLDETMRAGKMATAFVKEKLREPFTIWTRWATAGGRSKEPRYYCFVLVGTNALDELLIGNGLARPKGVRPNLPGGEKAMDHEARLRGLEAEARQQKVGLWAITTAKVIR